jgi:5-(carboxyamino)imidazole ribonucleotide synthase
MSDVLNRIGILGGGQLALMLAEAAQDWGLEPLIFASSAEEPAYAHVGQGVIAPLQDKAALERLSKQVGTVIFESDFFPFDVVGSALDGKAVPSVSVVKTLADKIQQREIFDRLGFASPRWKKYSKDESASAWLADLLKSWPSGVVLKQSRGGYDGRGVFFVDPQKSAEAESFITAALQAGVDILAEEKVGFKTEAALVGVRSTKGDLDFYPLVFTFQENGICRRVWGPASCFGVKEDAETQLRSLAKKLAEEIKIVGVFAIEFFGMPDGAFLVNELACRVHNSGHFSLRASRTSQFENHIRACLGQSLGQTTTESVFMMQNILGDRELVMRRLPEWDPSSDISLKWYHKKLMKPGRKLGHAVKVNFDVKDLEKVAHDLESRERAYLAAVR